MNVSRSRDELTKLLSNIAQVRMCGGEIYIEDDQSIFYNIEDLKEEYLCLQRVLNKDPYEKRVAYKPSIQNLLEVQDKFFFERKNFSLILQSPDQGRSAIHQDP